MLLMPKTMKGKLLLKFFFQGNIVYFPKILDDNLFPFEEPNKIPNDEIDNIHTAIFTVCKK